MTLKNLKGPKNLESRIGIWASCGKPKPGQTVRTQTYRTLSRQETHALQEYTDFMRAELLRRYVTASPNTPYLRKYPIWCLGPRAWPNWTLALADSKIVIIVATQPWATSRRSAHGRCGWPSSHPLWRPPATRWPSPLSQQRRTALKQSPRSLSRACSSRGRRPPKTESGRSARSHAHKRQRPGDN